MIFQASFEFDVSFQTLSLIFLQYIFMFFVCDGVVGFDGVRNISIFSV